MDQKAEQVAPAGAFTPGPFTVFDNPVSNYRFEVRAPPGPRGAVRVVARVPSPNGQADRVEANAHLFAASPDLFSVLKALLEDMEDRYDPGSATAWMGPHIVKARAALAKADGTAK